MIEKNQQIFEYKLTDEGATILGQVDHLSIVYLPERIESLPVKRIEDRAFEKSAYLTEVFFPELLHSIGNYSFCECRGMNELKLNYDLETIGSHAFYNCRNLETIRLRSSLREIGDGAFKNCTKIHTIYLQMDGENVQALSLLLEELQQELTVCLQDPVTMNEVKLYLPRDLVFFSEYTSRLYNPVGYAVGYQYRQAVLGGSIDYERYDSLFLGAMNELTMEPLLEIAILRLMYPNQLAKEARAHYASYVTEHVTELVEQVISGQKKDRMEYLLEHQMLTKSQAESAYDLANQSNHVDMSASLLQYRMKHFHQIEDEFEL